MPMLNELYVSAASRKFITDRLTAGSGATGISCLWAMVRVGESGAGSSINTSTRTQP